MLTNEAIRLTNLKRCVLPWDFLENKELQATVVKFLQVPLEEAVMYARPNSTITSLSQIVDSGLLMFSKKSIILRNLNNRSIVLTDNEIFEVQRQGHDHYKIEDTNNGHIIEIRRETR